MRIQCIPTHVFGTVDGQSATELFENDWLQGDFLDAVSTRGKSIIMAAWCLFGCISSFSLITCETGGKSSNGRIVSVALPSEGWYGVPEEIVFSFPCRCENGEIIVVEDLPVDEFAQTKIDENVTALLEERNAVSDLFGKVSQPPSWD